MSKDKPLTVEIVDGVLNISLGIDILCLATQSEIYDFKIVHRMLDEAANNAIENGSEYIEEIGEDE